VILILNLVISKTLELD